MQIIASVLIAESKKLILKYNDKFRSSSSYFVLFEVMTNDAPTRYDEKMCLSENDTHDKISRLTNIIVFIMLQNMNGKYEEKYLIQIFRLYRN